MSVNRSSSDILGSQLRSRQDCERIGAAETIDMIILHLSALPRHKTFN